MYLFLENFHRILKKLLLLAAFELNDCSNVHIFLSPFHLQKNYICRNQILGTMYMLAKKRSIWWPLKLEPLSVIFFKLYNNSHCSLVIALLKINNNYSFALKISNFCWWMENFALRSEMHINVFVSVSVSNRHIDHMSVNWVFLSFNFSSIFLSTFRIFFFRSGLSRKNPNFNI